ncbi:hypothetical protein ACFL47_09715, partial [Candidatus Latescibacterota bacterium]
MLSDPNKIPSSFLTQAANVLGETNSGLSGSDITRYCTDYAYDFDVDIPYSINSGYPNKRTALRENLSQFSPQQQYKIIKEFCELERFNNNIYVRDLKIKLESRYSHFAEIDSESEINESLIEETRHWLQEYPRSLTQYQDALAKYQDRIFQRNMLDDLRLSFEFLLKDTFKNNKSLENNTGALGAYLKS